MENKTQPQQNLQDVAQEETAIAHKTDTTTELKPNSNTEINTIQSAESNKINRKLVENSELNGKKITLKTKTGQELNCELSIRQGQHGKEIIEIKDANGKILGHSDVAIKSLSNFDIYQPKGVGEYLANGEALYVDLIESRVSGANIGTELHNAKC